MHTWTNYDIPAAYGVTYVTLLVRDPRCIFAHWEVTDVDRMDATRRAVKLRSAIPASDAATDAEGAQLVLRLYDVTNASAEVVHPYAAAVNSSFVDFVVDERHSRYITWHEPGRTFAAQIGVRAADDPVTFTAIAASNTVRTPPGRASDDMVSNWHSLDELFRMARAGEQAGSSIGVEVVRERREEGTV